MSVMLFVLYISLSLKERVRKKRKDITKGDTFDSSKVVRVKKFLSSLSYVYVIDGLTNNFKKAKLILLDFFFLRIICFFSERACKFKTAHL